MPPPPKKRVRTCGNAAIDHDGQDDVEERAPVVFSSPGLKPDTQLMVFDQMYHVHSTLLKLHSNYFRRFLDSREKSASGPFHQNGFHYKYTTVVDDDGTWGLEPIEKAKASTSEEWSFIDINFEKDCFQQLLCAIYNRPYKVRNVPYLRKLVAIADFYCALPIVSATLTSALVGSSMFGGRHPETELIRYCVDVLVMAKKLRHKLLFKECFVLTVGQFSSKALAYEQKLTSEPATLKLVKVESNILDYHVEVVQHALFHNLMNRGSLVRREDVDAYQKDDPRRPPINLYRSLLKRLETVLEENSREYVEYDGPIDLVDLMTVLEYLLQNNLTLEPYNHEKQQKFPLCADIADNDLPWNQDEIDW